jgi:hypothetical protein
VVSKSSQDGLVRLKLPRKLDASGLRIWDTEAAPITPECKYGPDHVSLWAKRYRTIDLDQVYGITFFVAYGEIYGIHPHYSRSSSAMGTFRKLGVTFDLVAGLPASSRYFNNARHIQNDIRWYYMPVGPRDRITAVGTRTSRLKVSRQNILVSR